MNIGLSVTDKYASQIIFLAWSPFTPPYGHSMISSYQQYIIIVNYERGTHIVITHIFFLHSPITVFPYFRIYVFESKKIPFIGKKCQIIFALSKI